MMKTAQRILLATLLATAAACGSSNNSPKDASGTAGKGDASGTAGADAAAGAAGGAAGAAGSSAAGADGGSDATGAAGSDAADDAAGAAGSDAHPDATGAAGAEAGADATGAAGAEAGSDATGTAGADASTGSDAGASDVATGTDATQASSPITAASGGTLTIADGTLSIQTGGLAADTTITVAASAPTGATPDQASVIGDVLELGPSGTTFTAGKPALLALKLGTVPSGKRAVISTLVSNAWVDQPTIVANGKVYASLAHLSTYAVRAVGAVDCGTTFTTDVSCGTGTVTGTWNVVNFCNSNLDGSEFPSTDKLLAACTEMGQATPVTGGAATLNSDLTYSSTIVPPKKATLSLSLSATCTSSAASCDAVADQIVAGGTFVDAACTGTPAAGCACTGVYRPPVLSAAATGNYTVANGKLGFTGSIPARFYCANNASTPQKLYYAWGSVNGAGSAMFGFIFTQ